MNHDYHEFTKPIENILAALVVILYVSGALTAGILLVRLVVGWW